MEIKLKEKENKKVDANLSGSSLSRESWTELIVLHTSPLGSSIALTIFEVSIGHYYRTYSSTWVFASASVYPEDLFVDEYNSIN